ncbi:hypothetical protein IKE98_02050 [Candidatus Saccharibacteria bacterium]|nr:hypothetical protein [Candidatus Saccharibacteria bacterium]
MRENVKKRDNFSDINIAEVAYIPYAGYKEFPNRFEYEYGKEKTIILRNELTGELEEVEYKYSGAVPLKHAEGYQWYWGDVKADDYNSNICFYFFKDGTFKEAAITLCGNSLSKKEFDKISKGVKYPAEVTARF